MLSSDTTVLIVTSSHLGRKRPVSDALLQPLHHLRSVQHPHERVLPRVDLHPVVLVLELHLCTEHATENNQERTAVKQTTAAAAAVVAEQARIHRTPSNSSGVSCKQGGC